MEITKTSLTLDLLNRIQASYDNSMTRKIIQAILALWDKAVAGSLMIGFVTGKDLKLRILTEKPSFFGQSISAKWSAFLSKLEKTDNADSSYKQSKYVNSIKLFARLIADRPLFAIGWIGLAFLPIYGSLRLLASGLSLAAVIVILFSIALCVLLTFSKVTLPQIIEGSVFVRFLDGCDE